MATQQVLMLPLRFASSRYAIPSIPKYYGSGNNVIQCSVAKFLDGGEGKIFGSRTMPKTYDSASACKAVAVVSLPASGAGGEKIRMNFAYHAADPRNATPESLDPAAVTETVNVSQDISTWTAKNGRVIEWTLTATNIAAEDHLAFFLQRDPGHTDDNYANYVLVHEFYLLCYF